MATQTTLDGNIVEQTDEDEVFRELTTKLEEIFQFDKRDLDFGMYKILKLRRAEVEAFMEGLAGEIRDTLGEATPDERIEVCNHLVEFFSRYYREGDFMSLPRRNETKPEYAVPYWGEEVLLHWANRDQYYIKTSRSFKVYEFQDDGGQHTVRFTVVEPETPLNNTKGEKCYFILRDTEYDEVTRLFTAKFECRPVTPEEKKAAGKEIQEHFVEQAYENVLSTAPDSLRPVLTRPTNRDGKRPLLQIHLDRYTASNSEDFFIHKDLGGFLRRELDFYLKNAVIRLDALTSGAEVDLTVAVRKATAIKSIANRVIGMLDTTETMQRRLFEKKKLVVSADYCMTLDRVPEELYEEIAANDDQVAEWKELFYVDVHDRSTLAVSAVERMKACPSLVLDTRHFGEGLKDRLLASFDDLDEAVEGLMVKSENWQALNLLQARYGEKVKCIYIDPPYNKGDDKEFLYKDRYQHSSWLSMMSDRLEKSKSLLHSLGFIIITTNSIEVAHIRKLGEQIFGADNFLADIAWEKRYTRSNNANLFYSLKDTLTLFRKSEGLTKIKEERTDKSKQNYTNPDKDPKGRWISSSYINPATKEERDNLCYEILNPFTGQEIEHPTHAWKYEFEEHQRHVQENRLYWGKTGVSEYPRLKTYWYEVSEGMVPTDLWRYDYAGTTDDGGDCIKEMFGAEAFKNPKPPQLIRRCFSLYSPESNIEDNSIYLDFFAGSGTTAHAILNLNREDGGHRKYILIEMGEHFATVMKPRIMKAMYASTWKDGKPVLKKGSSDGQSHIFKYIALEQYEDTLANVVLPNLRPDERTLFDTAPSHLLVYLLDRAGTSPGPETAAFEHPFAVTLRLHRETLAHPDGGLAGSSQTRPRSVDLPETFAYLLGLHVIRRQTFTNDGRRYLAYLGRRNDGHVIVIWRETTGLDYAADRVFITGTVLPALRAGLATHETLLYINGEAWVEGARSIGPAFADLLSPRGV